ncbi:MAG: DCC1-like thiol-disulfide oxidoreductase family protein [Nitrospirota bacterium]
MAPTVIYDADCRLCESSKQWIDRWARIGRRPLRFLHFEEPEAIRLQPDLEEIGCLAAFRFLDEEGRAWVGERAAVEILKRLPGGRPVARLLALPGMDRIAAAAYRWVAAHRYRWFGRMRP